MRIFAFVFARGGSKGLPGKNIRPLLGKPLLCYSLDTAKQITEIEQIFVSTDDADIAAVAQQAGVHVIDRPAELATDSSSEFLSWQHAVNYAQERFGPFDLFVSLPCTAPLRALEDVTAAIQKVQSTGADLCVTMTEAQRSPYFNMVRQLPNGFVEIALQHDSKVVRRQDVPQLFDLTTVVYVSTPSFILNHSSAFAGKVTAIEVPKCRAVDIDDLYDFIVAEAFLAHAQHLKDPIC
jgi:N-acylneuraminate cytidylyltransferase